MTDEELIAELRHMGIDQESYRVVALLPLVQVAWADGEVQTAERNLIVDAAERHHMVRGDGARLLQAWLENAPTRDYVERGRLCLKELVNRNDAELGGDVDARTIDDVVVLCERVAQAAGGLFGILWTVDERERAVIAEIARALKSGT